MNFCPMNGTVLCKQLNETETTIVSSGILYKKEELPIYEIISVGGILDKYNFKVGDKIISNSIPTKLKTDEGTFYLIKQEYIAGKVID